MDFNAIIQSVSTVGFPVLMSLLFFLYTRELQKQHKEEADKMREAITNNTFTMQKLIDKLGKD